MVVHLRPLTLTGPVLGEGHDLSRAAFVVLHLGGVFFFQLGTDKPLYSSSLQSQTQSPKTNSLRSPGLPALWEDSRQTVLCSLVLTLCRTVPVCG